MNHNKNKILFLITGGTILSEHPDPIAGAVPNVNIESYLARHPFLFDKVEIEFITFSQIDSRLMTPEIWLNLAKELNKYLQNDNYCGAIILHGTDTLEETAFFLSLTCHGPKPVVLTGAMRPADEFDTDGPRNLQNAIDVILSSSKEHTGVSVVFNGHIYSPSHLFKTNTSLPNSFSVGRTGHLGVIENDKVKWFHRVLPYAKLPLPNSLPKVDMFFLYPGFDKNFLSYSIQSGAQGLVVVGYGCGNIHDELAPQLVEIRTKGVPIVMSTRVQDGSVFPAYGGPGGSKTLHSAGFVYHHDLSPFKARILLMLCIATFGQDIDKINECFVQGE